MLIVVRYTDAQLPDLFYFAEHPQGNVVYEGQRYVCLCAYSPSLDYSKIPEEYKARPWEWTPNGYKVVPMGERELKEQLKATFVKPSYRDEFTIQVTKEEEAVVDDYLRNAHVVEYSKFHPKVE